MIGLLIMLGVIPVAAGLTVYGLRGSPNEEPELGHNSPYPTTVLPSVPFDTRLESERDDGRPLEV